MTQNEPAPPPHENGDCRIDPEILRDLRRLAQRAGGLEKLKEAIDVLIAMPS